MAQWRVFFRKGGERWWKPYEATTAEAAVKQIRPRSRQQYVTRVELISRWSDKEATKEQ